MAQGSSSSCYNFELFSTALNHIMHYHMPGCTILHYLDDFLLIATNVDLCRKYLDIFKHISHDIGVPLSKSKTTLPSTNTIFLGIELDTVNRCARLPRDKLEEYTNNLELIVTKRSITKRNLQSLIGQLNFASSVVPARAFLRRLIDLLPHGKLPGHYINLTSETRLDLKTWKIFLQNYNGITFFRSANIIDSKIVNMCSDASKMGLGATFQSSWLQTRYPSTWADMHITILELYPVYIMISMFGPNIQNSNIIYYCDNIAVCHIVNKLSSKHKFIMKIVRSLVLKLVKFNIYLKCRHISGVSNFVCDKISRFQQTPAILEAAGMNLTATPIPQNLQPDHFKETCITTY